MKRAILDTSVLVGADHPGELEGGISTVSLAELHFGVVVAADQDERARRGLRLGIVEATFEPLPVTSVVAREWGRLAAAVVARGGQPRRRAMDLAIAATANVHGAVLLTTDSSSFAIIDDLVAVTVPT